MPAQAIARIAAAAIALTAAAASAQTLPRLSPEASVSQVVGITRVDVRYFSPGVKGRKIWGALVPYDQAWRTGANSPTTLVVDHDITFGGAAVAAGSYRLYTVPGKKSWKVVLNSKLEGGGLSIDAGGDVATLNLQPKSCAARERMTFLFENSTDTATDLVLEWEKLRLVIPITTPTATFTEASIAAAIGDAWRPHFNSARYYADIGKKDEALALYDKSIAIQETWWNLWFKAQLLAEKNDKKQARELALKARDLAADDPVWKNAFASDAEAKIAAWAK